LKTQVVNSIVDPLHVTVSGLQVGSTDPTKYVTVRLTNGTNFYSATGGGGGSSDSSDFDVEFPAFGVAAGFTNGTNLVSARAFDLDSGAGTQNVLGVNLRLTGNGGSVEFGTSSAPFRTDPTGTTTQPVSDAGGSLTVDGTVNAVQSGAWNITNVSGTVSLPTGAATAALQTAGNADLSTLASTVNGTSVRVEITGGSSSGTEYTEGDVDATITGTAILWEDAGNTLRAPSAATPLPVTVVSGGSAGTQYTEGDTDASITGTALMLEGAANTLVAAPGTAADGLLVNLGTNNDVTVTGTVTANQGGTWNVTNVSGTVSLPTGASTAALQTTGNTSLATLAGAVSGTEMQVDVLTMPTVTIQDGGGSITVDGSVTVSATNLDVRDLTAASDSVAVHGDVGIIDQLDLTNSNPATVAIVDANGDQITSFGGGVQYTENDVDASITGTAVLMESGVNTLVPLQGTPQDGLLVNLGANNDVAASQAGTWNITNISGTVSLPTGASTAALQTTGNTSLATLAGAVAGTEMQVDVLTMPTVTVQDGGGSLTVDNATLSVVGGGVEAAALRVTIASDSTGVVSVDDNGSTLSIDDGGGAITVDGTVTVTATDLDIRNLTNTDVVTAELSAVDNAVLDAIAASLDLLDNAVSGTELQVDVLTMPTVTVQDGGSSISIDDNGGSITVDGSVTVSATNLDVRDLTAASDSVAVHGDVGVLDQLDLTNSNPAVVAIVDANGDQITSFGGGTQYTEDAAAAADPVGTAQILVRADTPATVTSTDGDNVAQRGTNYGAAYVQVVSSTGSFVDTFGGGTQYTEADTDASITGTAMMMEGAANALVPAQGTVADGLLVNLGANNDVTVTGTVTVQDGGNVISIDDAGASLTVDNTTLSVVGGGVEATALRVTIASDSTGVVSVDDNGSTISIDDGGGSITVDGTVAVSNTTNVAKLEDDASAHQDAGIPFLAVRKATPANTSGTDGDYEFLQMSAGRMWTSAVIDTALPAGTNNIGDVDIASITAGDNVIGRVKLTDGTDVADVLDLTNANPLTVAIVDGDGTQVTSFGGGTQYTEAATDASITGTAMLMEGAADTLLPVQGTVADGLLVNLGANNDVTVTGSVTANAGTNLNTSALALEAGGNLAGAATSLAILDDWDETDRCKVNPIAGQAGVQGGSGAVSATTQRVVLATDVALPAGTNNIGDVDVLSVVPGTTATALGKAEDAGHTTGDTGVMALAVRSDAGATGSPTVMADTSLDYIPLATDSANRLYTNAAGSIAHDSPDSTSFPVKVGGQARTTNPTAVADADRVNFIADDLGRQVVVQGQVRDLITHQTTTITNSSAETTILTAGAAGVFHDLVQLVITNQTATAVNVTIKDATAGTTRMIIALPASGGAVIPFTRPVPQAAAAGNWTATLSVNTVTVNIFVMAEKNV
jgi:hypothetical protein